MVKSSPWRRQVAAVVVAAAATAYGLSSPQAQAPASIWNEKASADLARALHHMHQVWDTGDISVLKNVVVGDDTLVTFELDPSTHTPIRLASKRDLDGFIDSIMKDQKKTGATIRLESPVVNCKASDVMGVCTEECTVHETTPDGVEKVHRLWSTATAVKSGSDWTWVQWHMSLAAPPQVFKHGQPISGQK